MPSGGENESAPTSRTRSSCRHSGRCRRISNRRISWCVVGGESGPGARPFDVEWARSLLRQARSLPFLNPRVFVKQLGRRPLEDSRYLTLKDRAGADPSEWPEDLRVQEFPR